VRTSARPAPVRRVHFWGLLRAVVGPHVRKAGCIVVAHGVAICVQDVEGHQRLEGRPGGRWGCRHSISICLVGKRMQWQYSGQQALLTVTHACLATEIHSHHPVRRVEATQRQPPLHVKYWPGSLNSESTHHGRRLRSSACCHWGQCRQGHCLKLASCCLWTAQGECH
jgi:hypothetical protein